MADPLILNGDARHLPLPDASVHLCVLSPPYNARVKYDEYDDWLPWSAYWEGLIEPALRECDRVLVHGGRLCLNLANVARSNVPEVKARRDGYTPSGKARPIRYRAMGGRKWSPAGANGEAWAKQLAPLVWNLLDEIGFLSRETITWVKADRPEDVTTHSTAWGTWCTARNPVLRAVGEPVFIASKGSHAREPGVSDLTPDEFKCWTRNVWFIDAGAEDVAGQHPAYFPVELARRLIKLYSYVGDVVLDSFNGSGTTTWAAKITGRRGIGVELSANYCRLAQRRCSQGLLSLMEVE